jgi:hypothetical protein
VFLFLLANTVREEEESVCAISFLSFEFVPCIVAKRISLYKKAVTIFYVYISRPVPASFLLCFYGSVCVISLNLFFVMCKLSDSIASYVLVYENNIMYKSIPKIMLVCTPGSTKASLVELLPSPTFLTPLLFIHYSRELFSPSPFSFS